MTKSTVSFFLPTRKGSERVKNKNTRPFADIEGGLVENKIRQLLATTQIDEILFSSNDEICLEIAGKYVGDSRLRILPRPAALCSSTTNLKDLILYVPTITDCDHILWGHVTTPLVHAEIYDSAITTYKAALKEGYDSLVSVSRFQNFLLDAKGKMVNNSTELKWPRTQDLEPLYEINHAIFLCSRSLYEEGNRIGERPMLFEFEKLRALDIDWEEDFVTGEILYKYILSKGLPL